MKQLHKKYLIREAVIILGGPSIIENDYDLSLLSKRNSIIFLDAKALTPKFLSYGIEPHYFLMYYPEKCRTNSLQQNFLQAISCGFDMTKHIKGKFLNDWLSFRDNFNLYADIWCISRPHKKFRIKKEVILKNSPFDLLRNYKNMSLITFDKAYDNDNVSALSIPNKIYKYTHSDEIVSDLEKYYNPEVVNGILSISNIGSINSSAIALYPLLKYMGFKKVFFVGMDMSLLGSMEYAVNYTFKSMKHFCKFFNAARETYSYTFPRGVKNGLSQFFKSILGNLLERKFGQFFSNTMYKNLTYDIWGLKGRFMRDRKQFAECKELFRYDGIEFINIYEPFKYARPIPGIRNISYKDFLND